MPEACPCQVPVLFLIHRRLQPALQVVLALRQARPAVLLIAADGPRDDPKCDEVRRQVLQGIDWPCQVQTRFLEDQLGCRRAVSSALDWAFGLHEQLIILEDDCVPHLSFFTFCEAMLDRFQDAPEVMQICGSNLTGMRLAGRSCWFSRFGPIWGWASWRRAWQAYDVEMKGWEALRSSPQLRRLCPEPFEASWRREVLDAVHRGAVDTWDYQWAFAKLRCGGLNVVPAVNLVSNIGFGPEATHTLNAADPRAEMPTQVLAPPWHHPEPIQAWLEADRVYLTQVVGLPESLWSRKGARRLLRSLFRR